MTQLKPNRYYKLTYIDGVAVHFKTLDYIPEAKHLISVKDVPTGETIPLIDLLSHPWESLTEISDVDLISAKSNKAIAER